MTLKNQDEEIVNTFRNFLFNSPNRIKRVYKRKLIVYGDNYLIYTYNQPKTVFYSSRDYKPKLMKNERNQSSFWRARQNLIRLIACNVDSAIEIPTFWTFTFDPKKVKDVRDLKTANYYFKIFRQQLVRKLGFLPKYIAVPEFQKNDNVHYHVIFFNVPFIVPDVAVYKKYPQLLNKKIYDFSMNDIWNHGFTDVKLLSGVKHISLYLIKYMSKSFHPSTGNRTYGEKLYFSSKGLKRPEEYYDKNEIYPELNKCKLKILSTTTFKQSGLTIRHLVKEA